MQWDPGYEHCDTEHGLTKQLKTCPAHPERVRDAAKQLDA